MTYYAELIDAYLENGDEDYVNLWEAVKWEDVDFPVVVNTDVSITSVVASHGGEGEGDQYWVVIAASTPDGDKLFRKDGYYQSYDGGYLDGDCYEVESYTVEVTKYRKVK